MVNGSTKLEHSYNELHFNNKNEQTADTHNHMDNCQMYYPKRAQAASNSYILMTSLIRHSGKAKTTGKKTYQYLPGSPCPYRPKRNLLLQIGSSQLPLAHAASGGPGASPATRAQRHLLLEDISASPPAPPRQGSEFPPDLPPEGTGTIG